eukprot:9969318-Alexandrium_andersonii.AAC.1
MLLAALARELPASDLPNLVRPGQGEGPGSQVLTSTASNGNMHNVRTLPVIPHSVAQRRLTLP